MASSCPRLAAAVGAIVGFLSVLGAATPVHGQNYGGCDKILDHSDTLVRFEYSSSIRDYAEALLASHSRQDIQTYLDAGGSVFLPNGTQIGASYSETDLSTIENFNYSHSVTSHSNDVSYSYFATGHDSAAFEAWVQCKKEFANQHGLIVEETSVSPDGLIAYVRVIWKPTDNYLPLTVTGVATEGSTADPTNPTELPAFRSRVLRFTRPKPVTQEKFVVRAANGNAVEDAEAIVRSTPDADTERANLYYVKLVSNNATSTYINGNLTYNMRIVVAAGPGARPVRTHPQARVSNGGIDYWGDRVLVYAGTGEKIDVQVQLKSDWLPDWPHDWLTTAGCVVDPVDKSTWNPKPEFVVNPHTSGMAIIQVEHAINPHKGSSQPPQ